MNLTIQYRDLPDWDDKSLEDLWETKDTGPGETASLAREVYDKWRDVVYLFRALIDSVADEGNELADPELRSELETHLIHMYLVGAKFRDSATRKDYLTRMEDAVFIRQVSLRLCTYVMVIAEDQLAEESHAMAVTMEILKYQKLFIKWVKSFEKDTLDAWGVFTDSPEDSW